MWTISQIWNSAYESQTEDRVYEPRRYIYASELGKSDIDIILALRGQKPSNLPDSRALRKMEVGSIFEEIVKIILLRSGILIASQEKCDSQYKGLLEVHGRLDFVAGGKIDWTQAQRVASDEFYFLPARTRSVVGKLIEGLAQMFPDGLDTQILEIKSCSSTMFEVYEENPLASENHVLQIYHYLRCKKLPYGHIVYLCRDDLRMLSVPVLCPSDTEIIYKNQIERITNYLENDIIPDPEPIYIFDPIAYKIRPNWKVGYSRYLTEVYGYENENFFGEETRKNAERWNRTLTRVRNGDKMTELNLANLEEIKENLPDIYEQLMKKPTVDTNTKMG